MEKKAISLVLILLGVAITALAINQFNQLIVNNAQSETAKIAAEAQITASEELSKSYGLSDADIKKNSADARALVDKTIAAASNSNLMAGIIDLLLGIVLLFAGIFTYPKER